MQKNLLIGFGIVGEYINNLSKIPFIIYDPKKNYNANLIDNYDLAFICVPTEEVDNVLDISIVCNTVKQLTNTKCIVIKSTMPVGTCETLNDNRIIFSPEFYGKNQQSYNYNIIGGGNIKTRILYADWLQENLPNNRIIYTDYRTAELVKLMDNSFLATKVSFCLEFANIAKEWGIDYNELRQLFLLDDRIGKSHTIIKDDQTTWSSHCLNKDTAEVANRLNSKLIKFIRDNYMEKI